MMINMLSEENRKHRHNSEVRSRILKGAAPLFRAKGYDAVSIDAVMAAADLTRGAFYAHFKTKDALFAEVVRHEHPLLTLLQNRSGPTPVDLAEQALRIMGDYLRPEHLETIRVGCSLAALSQDTAQRGETVRAGFEAAHGAILEELARGQGVDATEPRLVAALTLAVGSVHLAAANASERAQRTILTAGARAVLSSLETLYGVRHPGPAPFLRGLT